MKKLLILIACLLAACSGESPYVMEDELGILEQPIFMPDLYGWEGGAGQRCDSNWEGGRCWVPDVRSATFRFASQHGCSQFTMNTVTTAVQQFGSFLPSDWIFSMADDGAYQIKCNNAETIQQNTRLGNASLARHEEHDSSRGKLTQHRSGTITLYTGKIANMVGWQCGSQLPSVCDAKRATFLGNVFRHEAGHVIGLGHRTTATGAKLMDYGFPDWTTGTTPAAWNQGLLPDSTETGWLDCYTPGSSTSDSC